MLRQSPSGGKAQDGPCPACGSGRGFVGHGHYIRRIAHRGRDEEVRVHRVRCRACGATHAVLPPGLVPYRAHQEGFVLAVLEAWAGGASNAEVRRRFGISETTRRRLLARARDRARALLGCGASRAAVEAALAAAGVGEVPAMHLERYGTRFAEHARRPGDEARGSPT